MSEYCKNYYKLANEVIRVKTDCPYFDNVGNLCVRIENGMVRCDEYLECEFKYIDALKEENEELHNIIEQIRREIEEDITCESQECGCDDYSVCLECLKNTILKIIKSEEN